MIWEQFAKKSADILSFHHSLTLSNTYLQAFKGLTGYPWYTEAFGINVLGTNKAKSKLSHVATVLAELLDNDNDGCVDDPNMMTTLQAFLEDMGGFKGAIFVQEVKDVPEGCICIYLSSLCSFLI